MELFLVILTITAGLILVIGYPSYHLMLERELYKTRVSNVVKALVHTSIYALVFYSFSIEIVILFVLFECYFGLEYTKA